MKTVYQSFNGKIFYDEDECLAYEKSLTFRMFDAEGLTDNADVCYVADIKTPEAAEAFIETCATVGVPSDGIRRDCPGVYVWDFYDEKYFLLDPLTYKALKQYYKITEMQE